MAAAMATTKQTIAAQIISFSDTRGLSQIACVSTTWRTVAETQWASTIKCPREEVARFFRASRDVVALLSVRDNLVLRIERLWQARDCVGSFSIVASLMLLLGLLVTGVLAVIHEDQNKEWPKWVIPLPLVVAGSPAAASVAFVLWTALSACPFACRRRLVRRSLHRIGPLGDDPQQFDNLAAALEERTDSFRADLERARADIQRNTGVGIGTSIYFALFWSGERSGERRDEWECEVLSPFFDGLLAVHFTFINDLVVCVPIWLSAVFAMAGFSSTACLSPVAAVPLVISLMCLWLAACPPVNPITGIRDCRQGSEFLDCLISSCLTLDLGAAILCLGLHLDDVLISAVTVAALFLAFIAMSSLGFWMGFIRRQLAFRSKWRFAGVMAWAVGTTGLSIGILALLQKSTGGPLAVLAYGWIVFVFLTSVPFASFAFLCRAIK